MTNTTEIKPAPDMAATIRIGSDRYAATVVSASPTGYKVVVRYDGIDREERTFYRTANGYKSGSFRLTLGERDPYRCPEF